MGKGLKRFRCDHFALVQGHDVGFDVLQIQCDFLEWGSLNAIANIDALVLRHIQYEVF